MPTLKLRFPGGRYHATPWGHHVNEGLIEWPPSPWRLLRALVACGFASQHWKDIPPQARSLIDKLASVFPSYKLPEITVAHSRHFMPIGELSKGREKTTLVWDTFANVGDGELLIHWPCQLSSDETALLAILARNLNYLGRSESWVEAELIPDASISLEKFNAEPHQQGEQRGQQWEQISLMAPIPADSYRAWQVEKAKEAIAHLELPGAKKKQTAKQKEKLDAEGRKLIDPYPPHLIACLTKDTSWWKGHGWSQPPGSQRVLYWRPSQSMQVTAPRPRRTREVQPVEMMLLALTTPSGNKSALPPYHRTLPQAELFHRAVVARVAKGIQVDCPELTGRDEKRRPLHDRHRHAHILPLDLDGDNHLDHLLIYAPMGLSDAAQQAIRAVRRTWMKGSVGELQVAMAGCGDLDILRSLPAPLNRHITQLLGPREGARIWESRTPFVPPRFLKRRGTNSLLGQINAELDSRGLPPAERVEELTRENRFRHFRHFVRVRQRGGTLPPVDFGFALRLQFTEPLFGLDCKNGHRLLMLGYGSHFGLGLFAAQDA